MINPVLKHVICWCFSGSCPSHQTLPWTDSRFSHSIWVNSGNSTWNCHRIANMLLRFLPPCFIVQSLQICPFPIRFTTSMLHSCKCLAKDGVFLASSGVLFIELTLISLSPKRCHPPSLQGPQQPQRTKVHLPPLRRISFFWSRHPNLLDWQIIPLVKVVNLKGKKVGCLFFSSCGWWMAQVIIDLLQEVWICFFLMSDGGCVCFFFVPYYSNYFVDLPHFLCGSPSIFVSVKDISLQRVEMRSLKRLRNHEKSNGLVHFS